VTSHSNLSGASKMEPVVQLPVPRPMLQTQNQLPSTHDQVAGIHFRKTNTSYLPPVNNLSGLHQLPPSHPYNREVCSSPAVLTPPHLHPKIPNYGIDDENGSPVSYNSVLDQNYTLFKAKVLEQKRMQQQQQLPVNQSQPLAMEMQKDGSKNIHAGDQSSLLMERYPAPNLENKNASTVREYSLKFIGNHPAHDTTNAAPSSCRVPPSSIHRNPIVSKSEETNLPLNRQPGIQLQQNPKSETLFYDTQDGNNQAVSPLVMHTHHKFHYGNSVGAFGPPHSTNNSYGTGQCERSSGEEYLTNSPLDRDIHFDTSSQLLQQRLHRRRRDILLAILCHPFQCLLDSEQLCRSFCFGAIDGMLTGAGILSAWVGLGLVSQLDSFDESSIHIKWIPIALTLSATFSDGICMAIGHVWSTRLVAGALYEERKEELRNFEIGRSDAKARLVDTLLCHGMLKIDAMSLADILEGYPDLFVSALLGEGFCAEGNDCGHVMGYGGLDSGPGVMAQRRLKNESYYDLSDFRDDPDLKAFSETVSESRLESFVMMLSFSSFSVIPSLIYMLLPPMVDSVMANGDTCGDSLAILLSLFTTAVVMFVLGVWKSRFYSSNWFMFGLKNMGVLVICIATAYSVGSVCGILIIS